MPYINNQFIEDLVDSADIVDVISKRISLKKFGPNYKACCPFHNEKTPSFSVSASKQLFKCFGCGIAGGVLQFIAQYEHLDFSQSVEALAKELGISVVYDKQNKDFAKKQQINQQYKDLMTDVNKHYNSQLRTNKVKNKVIDYLKIRKITGVIAKRFQLGFAPPDKQLLIKSFADKEELLLLLGLIGTNDKDNSYYQRFRNRLMFPIHNNKGDIIAFGARALNKDTQPKYLNSPETPIFNKGRELYGLYHCRKYSKNIDYILVVEGYMDVISLHQHGITTVVAALGTATSSVHLDTLIKTSKNIVFCFDGDSAGKKAAWRALDITLTWIKKGVNVSFLFLPDDYDPDSLIQKEGKKAFTTRINSAKTISDYLFDGLKEQVNFNTIEGKTSFIENTLDKIINVSYSIYQQQLLIKLAELVKQDIEQIKELFNKKQTQISNKNLKNTSTIIDNNYPEPNYREYYPPYLLDDNYQVLNNNTITEKKNTFSKNLEKMILLLSNYPNIANDIDAKQLTKIKKFDSTGLLYELINSLQLDEEFNKILTRFKNQDFFTELNNILKKELATNIKDEISAKNEFIETINVSNKKFLKQKIRILNKKENKTADEEKELFNLISFEKTIKLDS